VISSVPNRQEEDNIITTTHTAIINSKGYYVSTIQTTSNIWHVLLFIWRARNRLMMMMMIRMSVAEQP
jgi:hypothetical protein